MDRTTEADVKGAPESEEDLNKEREHFRSVLRAFDEYLPYCLTANNSRRKSLVSLPRAHQNLLLDVGQTLPLPILEGQQHASLPQLRGFKARLDEIDDRIRRNADLLTQIVEDSREFLGSDDSYSNGLSSGSGSSRATVSDSPYMSSSNSDREASHAKVERSRSRDSRKRKKISGREIDKIQSTLKQLVRDWSQEGSEERDIVYRPMIDAVLQRYGQTDSQDRSGISILVPGAGLGRLAFDFAALGFSCQGNEFSFYMLLVSHYILNKTSHAYQHTIFPFIHSSSNWRKAEDMLRPISIPDVLPSTLPQTCEFSMVAGEFCEVYSKDEEKHRWDVVATCFFIDTAKNVIRYLETLNHTIPIGGHWINAGPLLWHFENSGDGRGGLDSLSIELTLDELVSLIEKMGFEFEERRTLSATPYTGMLNSMLQYHYLPEFFVCRKVKDIQPAPPV